MRVGVISGMLRDPHPGSYAAAVLIREKSPWCTLSRENVVKGRIRKTVDMIDQIWRLCLSMSGLLVAQFLRCSAILGLGMEMGKMHLP
jgi:hypothetical protein